MAVKTKRMSQQLIDGLVASIMEDTPDPNKAIAEEVKRLVVEKARGRMPKKVRDLYDDANLRGWLESNVVSLPGSLPSVGVALPRDIVGELRVQLSGELAGTAKAYAANADARRKLERTVRAALSQYSTVKQALNALPEFEKYLRPHLDVATPDVPAPTGLITDLMAAGWPDGKKPSAK